MKIKDLFMLSKVESMQNLLEPSKIKSLNFFYTYVLKSRKDRKNYIGYTNNLKERIHQHNKGYVFSTRSRRPFELIYYESCLNEEDAKQREQYLKSTTGRRWLGKRLKNFNQESKTYASI